MAGGLRKARQCINLSFHLKSLYLNLALNISTKSHVQYQYLVFEHIKSFVSSVTNLALALFII